MKRRFARPSRKARILGFVWGDSARGRSVAAARVPPKGRRLRFGHIGSVSRDETALPGAALRAAETLLMGSGIGSVPAARLIASIGAVLDAAGPAGLEVENDRFPADRLDLDLPSSALPRER